MSPSARADQVGSAELDVAVWPSRVLEATAAGAPSQTIRNKKVVLG
jgi:hypothetical protein